MTTGPMKTRKLLPILLIIACFFGNTSFAQTAIKAGHLILPDSEEVLENQFIIIENKRIVELTDQLDGREVDNIIDLSNSWISPGLIDCHVHLTANQPYRNFNMGLTYIEESNAYRVLRGVHNAEILLHGGFTTVKEIGNDGDYATADLIKAIASGWIEGPNIIYAGKIIAPYGGQTSGISYQAGDLWKSEYIDADTHGEIRKAIRQNLYYGANTIKLVAQNYPLPYFYSQEDIAFAVQEAERAGVSITAHAVMGESAKNSILGGIGAIEHGFALDNELLKLMKSQETYLVGTDFSYENWYAYGMDSTQAEDLSRRIADRLRRADSVGVKLAFGTDIVIDIPGKNRLESNLEVLKSWKAAEIHPMKTLQSMTSNAADLLGVANERGNLSSEQYADIVAFESNPLEDISNINSVHFVMKEGKVVRLDEAALNNR